MREFFLSGGSGFIGKNLSIYFANSKNRYKIVSPSRTQLDLSNQAECDIFFKEKYFECIINAANKGGKRNESNHGFLLENLKVFNNIFAKAAQCKTFIQLGSGAEYGRKIERHGLVAEELHGRTFPTDEYGNAKYYQTKILSTIDNSVVLHFFGVFGPHEDYAVRFLSQAVVRVLFGLPIVINKDVIFDYLDINDACKIIEFFVDRKPVEKRYNVGSGAHYRLSEFAEIIREEFSDPQIEIIVKDSKLAPTYAPDVTRLKDLMGPHFVITPIRESIKKLIEWYQINFSQLSKVLVSDAF